MLGQVPPALADGVEDLHQVAVKDLLAIDAADRRSGAARDDLPELGF